MTLTDAIVRNKELRGELLNEGRLEKAKAVKLGIEAIEWYRRWRSAHHAGADYLLPGETEETENELTNSY